AEHITAVMQDVAAVHRLTLSRADLSALLHILVLHGDDPTSYLGLGDTTVSLGLAINANLERMSEMEQWALTGVSEDSQVQDAALAERFIRTPAEQAEIRRAYQESAATFTVVARDYHNSTASFAQYEIAYRQFNDITKTLLLGAGDAD